MFATKTTFADRIASAVDLVIDFTTLGEYGLEPASPEVPADGRCELDGRRAGWEALAPRRGDCRETTRARSKRARVHG